MRPHWPAARIMGRIIKMFKKLIMLAFVLALVACGNSVGSSYIGKWVSVNNANDTFEITRNGDNFLVKETSLIPIINQPRSLQFSAVLKDGLLQIQGDLGSMTVAYIKATDTLTLPGEDFRRVK
jgi:hypothetical protein